MMTWSELAGVSRIHNISAVACECYHILCRFGVSLAIMYMLQEMAIQIDSLPVFYRQRDTLFYPSVIFTSFYPCHPCLHLTWMLLQPVFHANPFDRLTVQVLLNASY